MRVLEADFEAATVDVDFTGFDNDHPDLSWDGLAMEAGAFEAGDGSIEGSFYGAAHEGAAGTFARGGLAGVFGALTRLACGAWAIPARERRAVSR